MQWYLAHIKKNKKIKKVCRGVTKIIRFYLEMCKFSFFILCIIVGIPVRQKDMLKS